MNGKTPSLMEAWRNRIAIGRLSGCCLVLRNALEPWPPPGRLVKLIMIAVVRRIRHEAAIVFPANGRLIVGPWIEAS